MKDPNPIIPPGANLENTRRGRSRMRFAVVGIVLAHVVILGGGLLLHGCSQEEENVADNNNEEQAKTVPADGNGEGGAPIIPPELPDPSAIQGQPVVTDNNNVPPTPGVGAGAGGPAGVAPPPGATQNPFEGVAPTPPTVGGNTREHVILSGDNYTKLSNKYNVSIAAIQQANPSHNPNRLQIGKKLIIPAEAVAAPVTPPAVAGAGAAGAAGPGTYIVKRGDTLSHIAVRHNTSTKELQRVNSMTGTRIFVNQKLQLPPGARFSPSETSGTPGTE